MNIVSRRARGCLSRLFGITEIKRRIDKGSRGPVQTLVGIPQMSAEGNFEEFLAVFLEVLRNDFDGAVLKKSARISVVSGRYFCGVEERFPRTLHDYSGSQILSEALIS